MEEIVKAFERKERVKLNVIFGGSGFVLSQMILSKKGDIFFPGSSDFMEKAKDKGVIYPETEKPVVYLVPAIVVPKGNPKGIKSLKDLAKNRIKVIMANPKDVCVGLYAVEIIENNFNEWEKEAFKKNLLNYTESCEKTATAISLGAADAAIGWSVFQYWDRERIEVIPLKFHEVKRIGYIPIAISKFTRNRAMAQKFIDFVTSKEGKAIFKKHGYYTSPEEAFYEIGGKKVVGGCYILPKNW